MTKNTEQRDQFNFNVPSYRSYRVDQANKNHQSFRSLLKSISDKNIINDHDLHEIQPIQNTVEATTRLALILQAKVFQFHRQLTESTRVEEKLNLLSNEPLSRFIKRALNEYLDYHFQEIAPRLQQVIKSSTVIDITDNR